MKKTLKSLLAGILAVLLLVAAVPMNVNIEAAAKSFTSGYYTYTVKDGNATITGVDESIGREMVVPETLDGYPVTAIGDSAFYYNLSFYTVTLPDSITSIGKYAFEGTWLRTINIPAGVTSIGKGAFYGSELNCSITLPNGITSIEDNTFQYCDIKEIVIPDSVTSIGDSAFESCHMLKSITIPYSVTSIGKSAFLSCDSLKSIIIPDGVTSISAYTFKNCSALKSITIPDSVTRISEGAFSNCSALKTITIPDSVTRIDKGAFGSCDALEAIKLSKNLKIISENTFSGCYALKSITIPDSVTSIHDSAFYNCYALESITVPDSVKSIYSFAFGECTALKSITIPSGIEFIYSNAFSGTAYYKNTKNWENNVLYINDNLIEAKDTLSGEYKVKQGTKTIGSYAFDDCEWLRSITIPDSVTIINENAFRNCRNLESISIPGTITSLELYPFSGCYHLYNVYYANCEADWNKLNVKFGEYPSYLPVEMHFANENHTDFSVETITAATCTKAGSEKHIYSCGCFDTAEVPATDHNWGDWKVTKAATVKAEGKEERACTGCKTKETRSIAKIPAITESIKANEKIKTSTIAKDSVFVLNGQTASSLKKAVSGNVRIVDKNSKAVADKAKLATGMQIVLSDSKGNVLDKVTVVVPGDVDGDGQVKAADARQALRAAVNLEKLETYEKTAADLDTASSKHTINSADARYILRVSVGLEKTDKWLKDLK